MTSDKKSFLNYINSFRGIAILYIVLGHCLSAFVWPEGRGLSYGIRIIFTNGTILFVFIAGYLFQYLSYKYEYSSYLKSKLRNVGLPYLIMSVPGILYHTLIAQRAGTEYMEHWPWIMKVIQFYLVGAQLIPFWFIPMIFIYYLLSPLFVLGDKTNILYFLLPVFFVVSLFIFRGGPYHLQSSLHYFFVYFFGMFVCKYRNYFNRVLARGQVLLVLFLSIVGLVVWEYTLLPGTLFVKQLNMVQHLIQCLFYIGFFIRFETIVGHRFDIFASLSFGIFFVHSYFISGIKKIQIYWGGNLWQGTAWNLMLFFVCIVLMSITFVLTIRHFAKDKSRLICGS